VSAYRHCNVWPEILLGFMLNKHIGKRQESMSPIICNVGIAKITNQRMKK